MEVRNVLFVAGFSEKEGAKIALSFRLSVMSNVKVGKLLPLLLASDIVVWEFSGKKTEIKPNKRNFFEQFGRYSQLFCKILFRGRKSLEY